MQNLPSVHQLFTENTLTPVTLVLTRIASLPALLRNWGVVLLANLVGALILAFVLATTPIFEPAAAAMAIEFWDHAAEMSWSALFFKGIMAGWLVASMVWLVHAARDTVTRVLLVFFIMYLVPSGDLFHCIIGACEAFYAVFRAEATLTHALFGFFTPVLLGNTIGGVLLVAILNYAQTNDALYHEEENGSLALPWRAWAFEFHTGTEKTDSMDFVGVYNTNAAWQHGDRRSLSRYDAD